MAAKGQVITVGTTPTLLFQCVTGFDYAALTSPAANVFKSGTPDDPVPFMLIMPASGLLYLGGSGVTSSSTGIGALVTCASQIIYYNSAAPDSLYGIVASSTLAVQLLTMRQ
jgi:hypothetical protein